MARIKLQENQMAMTDILKDKKILAVDDELDVLEMVREQLEGCAVATASSYEAG